ncbi:MAG: HAD family hydrolase [Deltaproteobacteria bacterium]|nr:HAD family hydrolase [Deltaproteobacteria bacterium]
MTKKPAVFLDRDGVLICEKNYLADLNQVQFYKDVPDGLCRLKDMGFLLIVITNQSGVARGYYPESFVYEVFEHINQLLEPYHITLDAHYYCPHIKDGIEPYNIDCDCRKPKPGMINQALKDYPVDLKRSFLIGDKISDIALAKNTGLSGIQLITGHGKEHSMEVRHSYPETPILKDFHTAVEFIAAKNKQFDLLIKQNI